MPLVLDVSVVAKWFIDDEISRDADAVLDRVRAEGAIVPALFRWEAQAVLLRATLDHRLTADLMESAFESLAALPIHVEDPGRRVLLGAEATLALRYDLTAYDAAYLSIALDRDICLATADNDLARAAREADVNVIHVR